MSPTAFQNLHVLLVMESNLKELDGTCFSPEERKLWDESDLIQWKQKIRMGAFAFYLNGKSYTLISSAPMRYVRAAKGNGDHVQPTRRLIIPGHLDSHIGTCRTDGPTTSSVAVQIAVTIAVKPSMSSETFEVSAAFP